MVSFTTINLDMQSFDLKNSELTIIKNNGLIRSAIFDKNGKLCCFSPLSSSNDESLFFNEKGSLRDSVYIEEYVEGTMINLFYNVDHWEIATKQAIGGNNKFFISNTNKPQSFKEMFLECCVSSNLNIQELDTSLIYSFVMQHVNNRIINPVSENKLYIIHVYKVPQDAYPNAIEILYSKDNEEYISKYFGKAKVYEPKIYPVSEYMTKDKIIDKFASPKTPYEVMGINLFDTNTGNRMKFRNPNYEELKRLRGNQAKLEYHYLTLRKCDRVDEFLNFFPEYIEEFKMYEAKIQIFMIDLYTHYESCYLKHEKPLREYPGQFKKHMYNIHSDYLTYNKHTTFDTIVEYVYNLPEAVLMSCLNYNLRNQNSSSNNTETNSIEEHEEYHDTSIEEPNDTLVEEGEISHEHHKKKHHGGVKHGKGKHSRIHHLHHMEVNASE